jgi:hypothetical protein
VPAIDEIRREYAIALQDKGNLLADAPALTADEIRDRNVASAIQKFSHRLPQIKTSLIASVASGFYAVPTDWQKWSRVVTIEYPLDQVPPGYLDNERGVRLQRREAGLFHHLSPNPSGSYRLTYTTQHDAAGASIDVAHYRYVGLQAAILAAEDFGARYAGSVSNNLDAVNYRTKEQEWRSVAKSLREQLEREMRRVEWGQFASADLNATGRRGWRV